MRKPNSTCSVCRRDYYARPAKTTNYCSRKCLQASDWKNPRKTGTNELCGNCGKLVYRKLFHKQKFKKVFCSRECSGVGKTIPSGPDHYGWVGGPIVINKRKNMRRRDRMKKAGELLSTDVADVIKCSGGKCCYCEVKLAFDGNHFTPNYFNLEHYIPLERGGTNERENLRASCHQCNAYKGTLLYEEWRLADVT